MVLGALPILRLRGSLAKCHTGITQTGAGGDILLGDAGVITRSYNDDGTPRKEVLLTDVGMITGAYNPNSLSWNDLSADLFYELLNADLVLLTGAYNADGTKHYAGNAWGWNEWETQLLLVSLLDDPEALEIAHEALEEARS